MTRADFVAELMKLWDDALREEKLEPAHDEIRTALSVLRLTYTSEELGVQ
jgi:hypothetical protein